MKAPTSGRNGWELNKSAFWKRTSSCNSLSNVGFYHTNMYIYIYVYINIEREGFPGMSALQILGNDLPLPSTFTAQRITIICEALMVGTTLKKHHMNKSHEEMCESKYMQIQ